MRRELSALSREPISCSNLKRTGIEYVCSGESRHVTSTHAEDFIYLFVLFTHEYTLFFSQVPFLLHDHSPV